MMAFSLRERIWGKDLTYHSPPALLFFNFFFLKWRSAHAHQFYTAGLDQSRVAKLAEAMVDKHSLTSCM